MGFYKDRTAELAVGYANREWKNMARIALKIRRHRCSAQFEGEWLPKFTGVFSRFLTDPEEELEAIANER